MVDKIIELSECEYAMLCHNLLGDYPFILENAEWMNSKDGVRHYLLALCEGGGADIAPPRVSLL